MAKKRKSEFRNNLDRIEEVKRLVVIAMFSDDLFLDTFVLKGGNALDLVHQISARASSDLDFSMQGDFPGGDVGAMVSRVESSLKRTLGEAGLEVFDFEMKEVPEGLSDDVADFWGGYNIEFKAIERRDLGELGGDLRLIRARALNLGAGEGKKFSIEISKFEHTDGKVESEFAGYRIYAYSPQMIVCEKLRAICQQMPEYAPIVRRTRPGGARARDFLDIHTLVTKCGLEIASPENLELLRLIFSAKRVPLSLLKLIPKYREDHRDNFASVKDTVKPGIELLTFDSYFDFVTSIVERLQIDIDDR